MSLDYEAENNGVLRPSARASSDLIRRDVELLQDPDTILRLQSISLSMTDISANALLKWSFLSLPTFSVSISRNIRH